MLTPLGIAEQTDLTDRDLRQGHARRKPVPPWHLAALAGAGGLRAPAADLLTFLETVRDGSGPLAGAIAETLRPRGKMGAMQIGLGWLMIGDGDLLLHNGGTGGARSEVRIERHSGTCVVVLGDARRGTPQAASSLLDPAAQEARLTVLLGRRLAGLGGFSNQQALNATSLLSRPAVRLRGSPSVGPGPLRDPGPTRGSLLAAVLVDRVST